MCGIAGLIGGKIEQERMQRMLQAQAHRGPDNQSVWKAEGVCLGHNRLSIIDLSTAANQPMSDVSGRYLMVFNGELYNYLELKQTYLKDYPFQTQGDSEVLLALYIQQGAAMLDKLIGMFAFAIWDEQKQQLFAARDRFGVKPFYYSIVQEQLAFASEIKALLAAGIRKEANEKVWAGFFAYGSYGLPHETFWQNIHALPAGHFLQYQSGELSVTKWYQFEERVSALPAHLTDNEFATAYLPLLQEAVSLRFRADVPVGINLSGGLDSSVLLAMVHQLYPDSGQIKAFSFYCNDDRYDELPWVREMIARTAQPLEPVLLQAKDVPDLAVKMAATQDEPFGGLPTIAYGNIFKQARQQGYKVLLDGQGIDEAWAGYDYYYKANAGVVQGTNQSPVKPDALQQEFVLLAEKETYPQPFTDRLQNLQYRDIFYTKIPRALRFNDRASMQWSVELREPFLDHRLVELAFAQPAERKCTNGITKYQLRNMAAQWLGGNLAFAPKRPLQTPQREWLQKELKDWAFAEIEWLANDGWFNKKQLQQHWQQYQNGESDNSFYIWQWINAAMLKRQ